MPTLPWTPTDTQARTPAAVVLASRLELPRYRQVPGFLRAALAIRRQVRTSPGALGVSLIAQPGRKTFWTLSAWADDDALKTFVGASPHREVMTRYRGQLTDATFTTFSVPTAELPPRGPAKELWADGKRRLAAATEAAAADRSA